MEIPIILTIQRITNKITKEKDMRRSISFFSVRIQVIKWKMRKAGGMKIYEIQENCLTIYLPREVDHHNADEIRKEADAVISRNHIRYVIFDFDRTDFMDSSGIGIIMGRYKTVSLIGGEVWAVHTNERIRKILTFSGATKIMQIYEGED